PPRLQRAAPPVEFMAVGVGHMRTATLRSIPARPASCAGVGFCRLLLPALLLGVGHKPQAVPPVRGADGTCGYAVPLRVIPARGQVPENSIEASATERGDVFHDDVAGS